MDKEIILHVIYKNPRRLPLRGLILSFMPPEEESHFLLNKKIKFYSGRKEMDEVRGKARQAYVDLIAKISATPFNGRTLRQALKSKGRGNPWWYHKTSEKHVETDEIYNLLLQIFTIKNVADKENIVNLILYGAPIEVAQVLDSYYKVRKTRCFKALEASLIKGVISRIKYLFWILHLKRGIGKYACSSTLSPDIVLQGFWDWSIRLNSQNDELEDAYFRSLPKELSFRGLSCAWFLWLDHNIRQSPIIRPLREVLSATRGNQSLIFVQRFLTKQDILSAIVSLRPLMALILFFRSRDSKNIFVNGNFNFYPLFARSLFYYFLDASHPHFYLMETACRKAFRMYQPKFSLSFLDFTLPARAFNQGAALGSPETIRANMQHTSYAREKASILIDKERELNGNPDSIPLPVPDYFFTMGELTKLILIEGGFPENQVLVTGSARYDYFKFLPQERMLSPSATSRVVLLATSLEYNFDFEMVTAAVEAVKGLDIELILRSHPYSKSGNDSKYKRFPGLKISQTVLLEHDLYKSGLVLFSYSSVAEEALVRGIPVIQWRLPKFNGSVFGDLKGIPIVNSISDLRSLLKRFVENPVSFMPELKFREFVLKESFYKTDGQAACRIAEKVKEILQ